MSGEVASFLDAEGEARGPALLVRLCNEELEAEQLMSYFAIECYRTSKYSRYLTVGGITFRVWVVVVREKAAGTRQLRLIP